MTEIQAGDELLTRESGMALIEEAHRWEAAYRKERDRLAKVSEMLKWIEKMARHHHRSYGHAKSFAKCEFPVCKGGREILADWEEE